jgi:hypothetical protein
MPTDKEITKPPDIIAQARALIEELYPHYPSVVLEPLRRLADIAERWKAVAVEERAKLEYVTDDEGYELAAWFEECEVVKDRFHNLAQKKLAAEAGNWRKIGPEQAAAIHHAIFIMDRNSVDIEVLRRLLPEDAP